MDKELGLSEKPRRQKPTAKWLLAGALIFQICVCAALFWFYDNMYNCSPMGCAAVVSMALSGTSQLVVQLLTNSVDISRLIKFYVWGALNGMWTRFWTEQLTIRFQLTVVKILWDQIYGNPMGIFMFLSLSGYWEGADVTAYLQRNYWSSLKASWFVWPAASVAQFLIVPHRYIALFNTAVNFMWTIVLGLIA